MCWWFGGILGCCISLPLSPRRRAFKSLNVRLLGSFLYLNKCTKNAQAYIGVSVMPLYRWYLNSAVRTWIGATSFWQNAPSKKNGIHQPELTAVRTAVRSGENRLIQHLQKLRKNPLEPPQIRVFREQEKKSVHFWCNFWDTKRAASVCLSTTCGFLSAVRGGFEPPVQ